MDVEVRTKNRDLALRFRANEDMARFTAAQRIEMICELAETYHLHDEANQDALVDAVMERRFQVVTGGPRISEYLCLELAGLMGCTPIMAASRITQALALRQNHPTMYSAVQHLDIDADRALHAVSKCANLSPELCEAVTSRWLRHQDQLAWRGAFDLLARIMVETDPELAREREDATRSAMGMHVWGPYNGTLNVTGRVGALDGRYFDAMVQRLADIIAPEHPGLTNDQLRAKAVGVMANPAYALALLQREAQPSLLEEEPSDLPVAPALHNDPHGCAGHFCGTITTALHKLRPRLELAVRIDVNALGGCTGSARIEEAGHITMTLLREELAGIDVEVLPVIDLNTLPAEDQYRPSARLVKALKLAFGTGFFPYAQTRIAQCDLDHTRAYRRGRRGQTRVGNLAWLSRRAHRAKTACYWLADQAKPGVLDWTSPLGFRYRVSRHGTLRL